MPKIPALVLADQEVAAAEAAAQPLKKDIELLKLTLESAENEYREGMRSSKAKLQEAQTLQKKSLTPWVMEPNRSSYTRYLLRIEGPSDLCWDAEVWLRQMLVHPNQRLWTLSCHGRKILPNRHFNLSDSVPNINEPWDDKEAFHKVLLSAADNILLDAGYILTNLVNE